jgi:predicted O-linked N-acetylglucosamine transferase (SPINDLY family)
MGPPLLAFALKPAPVQVSWLGVLGTTGLSTMDYYLGDTEIPEVGTERCFSETVYRLPVVCCYRPYADVPVAPSPCRERGFVTFGSFNNPRKVTREVVKLWSAILHLAPGSRLLLKYGDYEIAAVQDRYREWFREDGISPERVTLAGSSTVLEYLRTSGEIDVALDPFPYNGGSTTLDALWMGVPVVTLAGRLPVQRAGASWLKAIGMPDLIAQTPEQYVNAALFLAESAQKIPDLRQNVRQALRSSPLMDEPGFVRTLEEAYRDMWRTWCRGRS